MYFKARVIYGMVSMRLIRVVIFCVLLFALSVGSSVVAQDTQIQIETASNGNFSLDSPLIIALLAPLAFVLLEFFFGSAVDGEKSKGANKFRLHYELENGDFSAESPASIEQLASAARARTRKLIDVEELSPPFWEASFGITLLVAAMSGQIANISVVTGRVQNGELALLQLFELIVMLLIAKFISGFIIVNVIRFAKFRKTRWSRVLSIQLSNFLGFSAILLTYRILIELARV